MQIKTLMNRLPPITGIDKSRYKHGDELPAYKLLQEYKYDSHQGLPGFGLCRLV